MSDIRFPNKPTINLVRVCAPNGKRVYIRSTNAGIFTLGANTQYSVDDNTLKISVIPGSGHRTSSWYVESICMQNQTVTVGSETFSHPANPTVFVPPDASVETEGEVVDLRGTDSDTEPTTQNDNSIYTANLVAVLVFVLAVVAAFAILMTL
ncbi:MAG: hypothetical protein PVI21_05945 [Candidatus Woesebacteria bacterium]